MQRKGLRELEESIGVMPEGGGEGGRVQVAPELLASQEGDTFLQVFQARARILGLGGRQQQKCECDDLHGDLNGRMSRPFLLRMTSVVRFGNVPSEVGWGDSMTE